MNKKNLLCYMDFGTPTGFATVAHNLLDRLLPYFHEKDIEVKVCATNYVGKPFWHSVEYKGKKYTCYVKSAKDTAKNMKDLWYRDGLLKELVSKRYDFLWVINDLPVMSPVVEIMKKVKPELITVLYTPIDSAPNPLFMSQCNYWNHLVTYTEYAKTEIERTIGGLLQRQRKIEVIPHGVDRNSFYDLIRDYPKDSHSAIKDRCREKMGIHEFLKDGLAQPFLFGNINKNSSRKNIGGTLLAFRDVLEWWRQNPDGYNREPYLYLHMHAEDLWGINIPRACATLGIEENVIMAPKDFTEYSTADMNVVYNALDVYVTTTTAEGWGLTVSEAMSVGLPIVAPMHTSLKEVTGSCVYGVHDFIPHIQTHDYENIRLIPDPASVFREMLRAYRHVVSEQFEHTKDYPEVLAAQNWDDIAKKWKNIWNAAIHTSEVSERNKH